MKFYITTSIPYVNASPHIGHAMEFVEADTIARYHQQQGDEVLLLSGADENALKNVQAAEKVNKPIQQYIDQNAMLFQKLATDLGVQINVFQKGSDTTHHFPSSQKLWDLCNKNGDIYKKQYVGLYCVGCEAFYTKEELTEKGECFEHPGKKLDEVSETNYFFKLSKYQVDIIKLIENDEVKITPERYKKEVLAFLSKPLLDISISRSNERAKNWGVPVPNDSSQRIYVWFDALNIYQSGIGFGWDEQKYNKWWPANVHVIGKGIVRFHAVYWIAFLLSAKLSLPKNIFVHGYITINGQKMSKTLGNVIDPSTVINKYGQDATRYYLLREIPAYDDGDFSEERMRQLYNSDLANELGNLVSRVTQLCANQKIVIEKPEKDRELLSKLEKAGFISHLQAYEFNLALEVLWKEIKNLNLLINTDEPWKKNEIEVKPMLVSYAKTIYTIADCLTPFLPVMSKKILESVTGTIKKCPPLFPRIS